MKNEQKALVKQSFEAVLAIEETAAALFYNRLFELDPSLRPLFKGDMKTQGKKLMATLKVCVVGLHRLDQILPAVQALGRRHVDYGVEDVHYDTVASALLWTLEKGLGEQFTPECREAWIEVLDLISGVMKEAAGRISVTNTGSRCRSGRRGRCPSACPSRSGCRRLACRCPSERRSEP